MSAEIQAACVDAGQPVPSKPAELARCIFDSLALLYAEILSELADLRGRPFTSAAYCRRRLPEPASEPALRRCLRDHRGGGPD